MGLSRVTMHLVSGLILVAVGLFLVGWGTHDLMRYFRERHVQQVGVAAVARVLRVQETGTRVNHAPEVRIDVEVMPGSSSPFPAQIVAVVSHAKLAALASPGAVVRVRYDPKDRRQVVLD
jgi:hypothetical protein